MWGIVAFIVVVVSTPLLVQGLRRRIRYARFVPDLELVPDEDVVDSTAAAYQGQGRLFLTTQRLIWIPLQSIGARRLELSLDAIGDSSWNGGPLQMASEIVVSTPGKSYRFVIGVSGSRDFLTAEAWANRTYNAALRSR